MYEQYPDIWPATSAMKFDDVAQKFRGVVRDFVAPEEAEHIITEVGRLQEIGDMSDFLGSLSSLRAPADA